MIRAPGTIQLDERRVSVIAMRSEGFVQKVADVTTGTHVDKGQPLMEVYSPAVSSAAAEYHRRRSTSKTTGGDGAYGRGSRQRLMNLDVPEAAIVEPSRTSRNVPTSIEWTAPRDGIVLERNAVEGMRFKPGDVLFRIADHSVVWVLADVAEGDLGAVAVGQPVDRAGPQLSRPRRSTGRSAWSIPQINKETRTARVRIELPNPDLALLPDMYADVEIATGSADAGGGRAGERGHRQRQPAGVLVDRARAASSRATSSSAGAATAMSRSATASPKATASSSTATS